MEVPVVMLAASGNHQQANTENNKTRTRWGGTPLLLATNVATAKTELSVAT